MQTLSCILFLVLLAAALVTAKDLYKALERQSKARKQQAPCF
jgi:hypothetical protein